MVTMNEDIYNKVIIRQGSSYWSICKVKLWLYSSLVS